MKYMIASDIHGSAEYCAAMLARYDESEAARLILLGDLLYHGPRNDLPREYAPKEVIKMLSAKADRLLCVRGNCDAEVDALVLPFPISADYAVIECKNRLIYATHGHIYGEECPLPLCAGDILLCGHTHIPAFRAHDDRGGWLYVNPGSVSIPKENSRHSYMLLDTETGIFRLCDVTNGELLCEYSL